MSTLRRGSVTLNNASGTAAQNVIDALAGTTFVGAAVGTRITDVTVEVGPTTAPGATNLFCQLVINDGTRSPISLNVAIPNTINTEVYKNFPLRDILPGTGVSLQAQIAGGSLASGATVHVTVNGVDNN